MKSKSIYDYILASERNLQIAVAVKDAWLEARERLIKAFLARLGNKLTRSLGDWKVEASRQFFVDPYASYSLWKDSWKDRYWIVLEFAQGGKKMRLGVMRNGVRSKKWPLSPELMTAVQKLYPSARARNWWETYANLQNPAEDWTKPEILWRIHNDPAFLTDVAEQMLQIAGACEQILDRLAKKK